MTGSDVETAAVVGPSPSAFLASPANSRCINITLDATRVAAIDSVTTNRTAWLADAALKALREQR